MSSSFIRVVRNLRRTSGIREVIHQMNGIGDIKYGRLVGKDKFGNRFYENTDEDEIHLRTRWVINKSTDYDVSQLEPGWHGWLGYLVDTPPNALSPEATSVRAYPAPLITNGTGTTRAYVPYSTTKPKITSWSPAVRERL
ncbi:NADH ubiquinone oxidoreductase subunit NDUFA12-domain-containing protein [Dipodascopsis tothii]|uniref:NADH ubiquinone oxidoreductase subunit NDUFA12-domain-containing protein n=1 Tax=Dipodascopsis tothii TaxID=44089 RepID=UPI0034CE74BC